MKTFSADSYQEHEITWEEIMFYQKINKLFARDINWKFTGENRVW